MTLTKEWLEQAIAELEEERDATPGAVNEDAAMALAAMKLALESLEAEPVSWIIEGGKHDTPCHFSSRKEYVEAYPDRKVTPLYATPPAPVSVPECFKRLLHHAYGMTMGHDWNKGTMAGHHRTKLCQAVEECRAAMLQGAEPVNKRDDFPFDYLQGQKDGLEWAAQLAEANHPQTGDWLYDDPIELAKAIRKGPDMPEPAGNSPVIPDGWTGSDEANAALIMLDRIETVDSVDDDRIEGIKRIIRALAAAPQQEVK